MDNLFSIELKELVSKSREIAIELGYDYISTIHFFLADCETKNPSSIFKFGFKEESEFEKFKNHYTLKKEDLLNFNDEILPLTKKAEQAIRLSETERMLHKQTKTYPSHLFIAALKNKESLLFECFKHDENVVDNLTKYYDNLGDFEKSKMTQDEISREYYVPKENDKKGLIKQIVALFRRQD